MSSLEINLDEKYNYPKLKIKVFYIYKNGNNYAFKITSDYFLYVKAKVHLISRGHKFKNFQEPRKNHKYVKPPKFKII